MMRGRKLNLAGGDRPMDVCIGVGVDVPLPMSMREQVRKAVVLQVCIHRS